MLLMLLIQVDITATADVFEVADTSNASGINICNRLHIYCRQNSRPWLLSHSASCVQSIELQSFALK